MTRAHLFQYDIAWEAPSENFDVVRGMAAGAGVERGDLIVLAEMFATGFSLNVETTADDDGAQAGFLRGLARETGAFVVGGITARGETKARNRALVFDGAGDEVARYDKVHPFSFGREHEAFEGGEGVTTFEWNGLRVCPVVCYDLRFPELFRAGLDTGAEAFVVIANWPSARQEHWRTLLLARAIENQAVVLGVNRCGEDPYLAYVGGTRAVGAQGEELGELGGEAGVLSVGVDAAGVRAWRDQFPAWRDRRIGAGDDA